MIEIKNIYIEHGEALDRLCSEIRVDGEKKIIWYEVEKEYSQYLCESRSDAFVVALLPFALAFKHDISGNIPISEELYWKLVNIYIPALAKFSNYYNKINLQLTIDNTCYESFAVGTGFSGGVDSFYTILKNYKNETKNFNVTHLTFFNVGGCGSYGGDEAYNRFTKRLEQYKEFVKSLGLQLVTVNSNISEFLMMSFNYTHTFRSLSAVLALQKLFKKYYYAAGCTLNEFSFNPIVSSYYDLLSTQDFSTENTKFYTTGCVESRQEKLKFISQYSETYQLLNVCNENDFNCRTCEKCIRTMGGLYSLGKLEKYDKVFDIPYFYKHLAYNIGFIMAKGADGTAESYFFEEIINTIKVNKRKIPILSYIISIPLRIKFICYKHLRKIRFLRRYVHKRISQKTGRRFNDK